MGRAKGGGGAKRTEKQNLARMARRKPFFETLRKLVLRWSAEVRGVRNCFPWGGLLVRFCPPLFFAPPFGVLWNFQWAVKANPGHQQHLNHKKKTRQSAQAESTQGSFPDWLSKNSVRANYERHSGSSPHNANSLARFRAGLIGGGQTCNN